MSSQPLHALWEASASQPFEAAVSKDAQFNIGTFLLLGAIILTSLFGLNLSFKNIALLAIPASFAFGFGAVYMICAVGVYYELYRPQRASPTNCFQKRKFHPVTSTLFILAWALCGFFVAFALAVYIVRLLGWQKKSVS